MFYVFDFRSKYIGIYCGASGHAKLCRVALDRRPCQVPPLALQELFFDGLREDALLSPAAAGGTESLQPQRLLPTAISAEASSGPAPAHRETRSCAKYHAMAAEGAAAAAVAAGAFGYNRENYLYDAEFRFERFAAAREYANQQTDQYREDIRALAGLTVKKNTLWCVTSTLCMALCVALYCAGRLGLHGPSPPAWIMGLWLTNNAAAFAFMALCIFLSIHASFRAQASGASRSLAPCAEHLQRFPLRRSRTNLGNLVHPGMSPK